MFEISIFSYLFDKLRNDASGGDDDGDCESNLRHRVHALHHSDIEKFSGCDGLDKIRPDIPKCIEFESHFWGVWYFLVLWPETKFLFAIYRVFKQEQNSNKINIPKIFHHLLDLLNETIKLLNFL